MMLAWVPKPECFSSPGLQKSEAKQELIQAVFFPLSLQHWVKESLQNTNWNNSQKKILLLRKQFSWKLASPVGDVPAQKVLVLTEICHKPQPVPLKPVPLNSPAHKAAASLLSHRNIWCCSSDPSRDLFTPWTFQTSPQCLRRKAGHVIHPTGGRTA